jgi:Sec-independent protein translocase protein TatA
MLVKYLKDPQGYFYGFKKTTKKAKTNAEKKLFEENQKQKQQKHTTIKKKQNKSKIKAK